MKFLLAAMDAGARLYVTRLRGKLRKLHHKLMVVDEQVVITGSFNYTGPATGLNDENIIILGELETKRNRQSLRRRNWRSTPWTK